MAFDLGLGTLLGGAISGIGSLFGSAFGSDKSLKAVREQNAANKELAEYAYQKNLEMWNRQNVYNSPVEQMARLKDAGLNPNLMYGQGNTGNASSAPSYDAPKMEAYTGFGDFGASRAGQELIQGLMGYAQVKKTEAEAQNIRQNTQNLETQQRLAELQLIQQGYANAKSKVEADNWLDLYRSKIAVNDSTVLNNFAHSQLADSQRFYTDSQRERFNLLTPFVVNSVEADLNQKLFDLHFISPAKLASLKADTQYKIVISKLADIRSDILFNELEFSNEMNKYVSERAVNEMQLQRYNVEIRGIEKDLQEVLKKHGVKAGSDVWELLTGVLFYKPYLNN